MTTRNWWEQIARNFEVAKSNFEALDKRVKALEEDKAAAEKALEEPDAPQGDS